ncbi:phage tail assembly protein [Deferribacter autotrophicus]|uniref:Phage tail assembly protein n=1 Tax=Deferribacter autotrophicus TaxID=500465 RepID=A0A5A8F0S7_9BACT|nr:phage tail assembly protein [Deferribacter autotrophicus]KAA0257213.1 phage tail assembly protein [Deferribacter autotrophicus]
MDKEYKLKYPVGDVKSVKMRRPKVKDLIDLQQLDIDEAERELLLFEKLTGVPKDILKEMDMYDYARIQEMYAGFLKG